MNQFKRNYKRKQFDLAQKEKLIQKENVHLIRQILDVDGKQERVRKETYYRHPNRNEQTSMHYLRSAQEQHRISQENRDILTRIVQAKSQYNVHKWEEDYYKKIALVSALHEGNYNLPPSRPISAISGNYMVGGKPVSSKINSNYSRYNDEGDLDEDELEEILFEKKKEEKRYKDDDDERLDFSKQKPTPKIPSSYSSSSSGGVRSKSAMSKQRPFSAHPSLIPQQNKQSKKSSEIENNNKPPLYNYNNNKKKGTRPFSANYPSSSSNTKPTREYELENENDDEIRDNKYDENNEMKYNEDDNNNNRINDNDKENINSDNDDDDDKGMNYDVEYNPNENDVTNQMDNLSLNLYAEQEQREKEQQQQQNNNNQYSIPPLQIDNSSEQNQNNNYQNKYEYEYKDDIDVESLMKDSPLPSNRDISPRRKDNNISPIVSPKKSSRNLNDDDDTFLKPDVSFNDQLYNNNKPTLSNPSTPNTQRSSNNNVGNTIVTDNEMKLSERKEEDGDENEENNNDEDELHSLVRIPSQRNVYLLYYIIYFILFIYRDQNQQFQVIEVVMEDQKVLLYQEIDH